MTLQFLLISRMLWFRFTWCLNFNDFSYHFNIFSLTDNTFLRWRRRTIQQSNLFKDIWKINTLNNYPIFVFFSSRFCVLMLRYSGPSFCFFLLKHSSASLGIFSVVGHLNVSKCREWVNKSASLFRLQTE